VLSLVFDIETVPLDWDSSFDDVQKEYLLRGASTDEDRELRKGWGGLNPLTGHVVCIGTLIHETKKGSALFLGTEDHEEVLDLDGATLGFRSFTSEAALLEHFWNGVAERYRTFVTFNGRNFDCPFLMLRSAALGVRPSVNMMAGTRWEYRIGGKDKYSGAEHVDLQDKLCFNSPSFTSRNGARGATTPFNLDFYTKAFGIPSPKSEQIAGDKVPQFFKEGRSREIAEYCMRDVVATSLLYEKWCELLKF
jgi:predicted PolB exonuclease-like 3'-5' exonuclease